MVFEVNYNPSNQPRMALGYSVFGQIALLSQAGLLSISEEDYQQVLETIAQSQMTLSRHVDLENNPAKLLAFNVVDRVPVITTAEHLTGSAHVMANQINENSKNYSEIRVIPEINHHLMEGLQFPKSNTSNLLFFNVLSDLYLPKNQKRITITEQIMEKNDIVHINHKLEAPTKLTQALELILFGSYTGFYLSMLNNQNPSPIPWVDLFKEQLKK